LLSEEKEKGGGELFERTFRPGGDGVFGSWPSQDPGPLFGGRGCLYTTPCVPVGRMSGTRRWCHTRGGRGFLNIIGSYVLMEQTGRIVFLANNPVSKEVPAETLPQAKGGKLNTRQSQDQTSLRGFGVEKANQKENGIIPGNKLFFGNHSPPEVARTAPTSVATVPWRATGRGPRGPHTSRALGRGGAGGGRIPQPGQISGVGDKPYKTPRIECFRCAERILDAGDGGARGAQGR